MTILEFKNALHISFKENRLKFVLKAIILLLSFLTIATLPIFTYRTNFNLVTNALSISLAVSYFVYFLCFGELRLSCFSVSIILFVLETFIVTAVTNFDLDGWLSLFNILAISVVIFQATQLFNKKWLYPLFIYFGCLVLALFVVADNFSAIIALDFSRIGGKFGDVNEVGLIFAIGIFFSIYLYDSFKSLFLKVLFPVSIILFFFLIFCTGSRGALLASGCLAFVYLFFLCLRKKRLLLFFVLLVVFVGIGFVILQIPAFSDLKERIFGMIISLFSAGESGDASASYRLYMMAEGLELWARHPFFGNGNQAFRVISSQNAVSHSGLSELLCSYGLVGFILWHWPLLSAVVNSNNSNLKYFICTFAFGFVLPCLFSAILYYAKMPMMAYAIIFGLFNKECISDGTYCQTHIVFNRFDLVMKRSVLSLFHSCAISENDNGGNCR